MARNDDAQLIQETLRGNPDAFGRLILKYQDRLLNTVTMIHISDCRQEIDDVVQETFVTAYTKLESFRGNSAFYTWLYRIAYNVIVDRQRRRRGQRSVDYTAEAIGYEPPDRGEAPHDRLQRQELVVQVRTALTALSAEHRAILVLRDMEGLCYETIAEMLNLPIGTVRSRLHRARSQLREQMKDVYHALVTD